MPCYYPLQAKYSLREDGKKSIRFSDANAELFSRGVKPTGDNNLSLPCGRCTGCRQERSRQWAVRIMHEASLHESNCFVTLTFNDESLVKMCPTGSLDRRHVQIFMKSLRQALKLGAQYFNSKGDICLYFVDKIRVFYCGEYGEEFSRPHYHLCLFNVDFPDKKFAFRCSGYDYFYSDILKKLWPYGNAPISDLSFDSAAYVARYCIKKITGKAADAHYQGRLPEFAQGSLKPGIAHGWIEKYGHTDVFPHDELVVRGFKCKPPRYYDKYLEKVDPVRFAKIKELREVRRSDKEDDNSADRLAVKEKCQIARFSKLIRRYESGE